MALFNKIKWILGILVVFILIVTTNLIDRNNFVQVRDSVVSIYEDRLVAKYLIFEMLKSVQQKELAVVQSDTSFFRKNNPQVNNHLESVMSRFAETELTHEEGIVFRDLKKNVRLLLEVEAGLSGADVAGREKMETHIDNIKENLNELSEIQLTEGSRQMSISKRAVDTVELFTQLEIYILIFLAVVIQIIVMYKPKGES